MKNSSRLAVIMAVLIAVCVLVIGGDALAQKEKKKSGKKDRESKKTEESVKKEKIKVEEGSKAEEIEDQGDTEKRIKQKADKGKEKSDERAGKVKTFEYRPKRLKDAEMREWENGIPPGWSRGKKTGWHGAGAPPGKVKQQGGGAERIERRYPPGSEEWDPQRKESWDRRLEKAKERIRTKSQSRGEATEDDEESAVRSVEEAAREGVPVEDAEAMVDKAIDRGMTGREIEQVTRAAAYGADKDIDYNELDGFMDTKMEEGQAGDELAVSIYQEIDRRHDERQQQQEQKKEPWWKRIFKRD